jgi:hypothetical protein
VEEDGLPPFGADGQAPFEQLPLEEAAPYLQVQGYSPAEGDPEEVLRIVEGIISV